MRKIIDSHVTVFPQTLDPLLERVSVGPLAKIRSRNFIDRARQQVRRTGRKWFRPIAESLHKFQPLARVLPSSFRKGISSIEGLASLPSMMFEATASDLSEVMSENRVSLAVAVALPPFSTNDFILREAVKNPNLIPVVSIESDSPNPSQTLKRYASRGARALKIHTPEGVDWLQAAESLSLPVILQTGQLHLSLPGQPSGESGAESYAPWFELYPRIRFLLTQMNDHLPVVALDLAERYKNIWLDTSRQPSEMIGEAVRRIGANRVLFASGWPVGGSNVAVGLRRIQECVEMGWITEDEATRVLGLNAAEFFGISKANAG